MATATDQNPTPQTPPLNSLSQPMSLRGAVLKLVGEYADGKRTCWAKLLSDTERFACFKALAADRGARYATATLDNFDAESAAQRKVVGSLRELQSSGLASIRDGGGIVLFGPEGTGKDHLQFAMLRHAVVECGYSVLWKDGLRLQDEIRRAVADGKEPELRERLREPHILAISDPLPPIGELNQWNLGFLRDVLDRRYGDLKSNWITFNGATVDDLKPILQPPLAARLLHEANCFHCNWRSARKPVHCS